MEQFMDIGNLLLIALILGLGMWALIYSVRLLRRGGEVTAEEAVKWRRSALKQEFYTSPDMNPDITDILVRVWRSWKGWSYFCLGIGGLLAGASAAIIWTVSGIDYDAMLYVILLLVTVLFFPATLAGLTIGLSLIHRERHVPGNVMAVPPVPHLSRLRVADWYVVIVLVANLVFMVVLIIRLAPGLTVSALMRAFALPGMWSVPVASATLIAVFVAMRFVKRWILLLPPLYFPQDTDVRQQADGKLRQLAIGQLYWAALYTAWLVASSQNFLLTSGTYPNKPIILAGLNDWYFVCFLLVQLGWIIALFSLLLSRFTPGFTQGVAQNGQGAGSSAQPQQ